MRRMRDYLLPLVFTLIVVGGVFGVHSLHKHRADGTSTLGAFSRFGNLFRRSPASLSAGPGAMGIDSENDEPAVGGREPASGVCQSVEYRGYGPDVSRVNKVSWAQVMASYHDVKVELLRWLAKRKAKISDKVYLTMQQRVRDLRIERPPTPDEPDLAWRGIGVYMTGPSGGGIVKVGEGFVTLLEKQPARARFEMARLVAQTLAPCELKRAGAGDGAAIWESALSCLGVAEDKACQDGSYSEAGWAASSAVAAAIAPPGCELPAYREPASARCREKL